MKYVLYRMDEHGNRAVVTVSDDYEKLNRLLMEFDRKGHKQTYWIEAEGTAAREIKTKGSSNTLS